MIVSKRHDTATYNVPAHGKLRRHARALGLSASVAVLMLCAFQAKAQSVTQGGGVWTNPADWSTNAVPTNADNVSTGVIFNSLTGVGTANNVNINANHTLTVNNGSTLTIANSLSLNSGNLVNSGTLNAANFNDLGTNQILTNTGQITFANPILFDDTTINNNAGGLFIAPTVTVTGTGFNNAAGATVQGNMIVNSAALAGIVNNSGTITGSVTVNNQARLNSDQATSIVNGNLTVNNGGRADLRNQVNGSITISGGTVNFVGTTNGITTLTANAGQLNVNVGTTTATGLVTFGGAQVGINAAATLQAGSVSHTAGTVNINGLNGTINTTTSYIMSGSASVINQGNLTVGTQLLVGAGTTLSNNEFISVGTNLTNNSSVSNNGTGIIAGAVINNGTLTNAGFIGGGVTNNLGTTNNWGQIANGVVVNGGTLNSNQANSIIDGGLTNSATANVRGQVNGAIQNNAAGTLNVVGATTGTGALTNAGTMAAGNFAFTGLTSVTNSGVITGSSGIRAATWNNTGNISGNTFGINTNGATTITNNGTIGGTTGSINFTANGNTLNITPLSVFNGAIFFNNTTGNTMNFGAGSYTIPVNAYRIVGNAINVSPVQTAITTGLNGAGTGNIVIGPQTTTAPTTTVSGNVNVINGTSLTNTTASQAREYTQVVSEMIGDVLTLDNELFDTRQRSNRMRTASTAGEQANAALSGHVNDEFAGRSDIQAAYPAADLFNAQPQFRPSQGVSVDGKGNMFWSRAFSGYRQTPAANGLPTIAAYYAGVSMGYDRRIEDYRVGAFAGYGATGLSNLDNTGNVKGDIFFGGIYARRDMGRLNVDGTLSGGAIANKSTRVVNGGAQNANGNFNGWMISPELAVGYRYDIASGWAVTPTLRARYVGAFYNGFTETGSPQNITYGNQAVHVIEERAEVRVTNTQRTDFGTVAQYYAQAAVLGTHRLGNDTLAANFAGVDFNVTNLATRDLFGVSLGAGLDWKMSANVAFYASGDGKYYTNGTYAAAGRGGIKVNF